MQDEPEAINTAFISKFRDGRGMSRSDRLNKWNSVAKGLVDTTYKERIPELEQRAKEVHEQEVKEWALELGSVEEAEDVHL